MYKVKLESQVKIMKKTKGKSGLSNVQYFNSFDNTLKDLQSGIEQKDEITDDLFKRILWLHEMIQTHEKIDGENLKEVEDMIASLEFWKNKDLQELRESLKNWVQLINSGIVVLFSDISIYFTEALMKKMKGNGVDRNTELQNYKEQGHKIVKFGFHYLKFTSRKDRVDCNCVKWQKSGKLHHKCAYRHKCSACGLTLHNERILKMHLNNHRQQQNQYIKFGDVLIRIKQISNPDFQFPDTIGLERIIVSMKINYFKFNINR